ncbi:hypothetical protein H0H92_014347, partial [Tricholoma furcatifolium]
YTHYAFFEWGLIFFDVLYDAMAEQEYREANLQFTLTKALVSEVRVTEKTYAFNMSSRHSSYPDRKHRPVIVTVNGYSTKTTPQTVVNGAKNSPDTRVKKKLVLISPHLRPAASFLSD